MNQICYEYTALNKVTVQGHRSNMVVREPPTQIVLWRKVGVALSCLPFLCRLWLHVRAQKLADLSQN